MLSNFIHKRTFKQSLYKLYGFINTVKYPKELYFTLKYMFNEDILPNKEHVKLASDWLLNIQNNDGGYSRKFSFISGLDISYIETTGYIIPTLLEVSKYLDDERYKTSACKAGEWLLSVQNSDGSYSEIDDNRAYAFDTGQVLIGLNYLYTETKDERYLEASKKASYWLANTQENDGSWKKVAYNQQKHTYYSRVAAAMLEYAIISNDYFIKEKALLNMEWVLDNQMDNGFFRYSFFLKGVPPYLHTIVYILEGLLAIYRLTRDDAILQAVLKNADMLKDINLTRDIILCSQYDENFNCVNEERCITGLAQWAGVCLELFELTKNEDYLKIASSTLFYLKSKQIKEGKKLKGSFPASVPFWGRYGGFDFVNWGNKFFIDSILLQNKYASTIKNEQENWVSLAFDFNKEVVSTELSLMDEKYIKYFDEHFGKYKDNSLTLLDLGCGRGRFLNYFREKYPKWNIIGVDPTFKKEGLILNGSAYALPFEKQSIDIIFTIEVLQHTYIEESMLEMQRVLKKDGFLVVGERNPYSVLGLVKPIFELTGRWMYPWDSPFKEKWFSKSKWVKIFKQFGFIIVNFNTINNPYDKKIKFLNRYYFIISRKK